MKRELLIVTLTSLTTICLADDGQTLAPSAAAVGVAVTPPATTAQRAARPRQVAIGTSATSTGAASAAPGSAPSASAGTTDGASGTTGSATNIAPGSAPNVTTAGTAAGTSSTADPSGAPVATGTTSAATNGTPGNPTPTDPKFASEAKWVLAGYNSDEIVYTVFVTNQDPRIIRCTTEVKGFYFENGTKLSIQDRQITTVFPNQPTRVGYWMDMDQQSGASYSVKCHPV